MGDLNEKNDLKVSAKFNNVPVKLTIELTLGQIHNCITSGIEGGFTHTTWARINPGKHKPGWANYFTATFEDWARVEWKNGKPAEKLPKFKLSMKKIREGLRVMQKKYPHHFAALIEDKGDAYTGDALIQCSLFGEILYC